MLNACYILCFYANAGAGKGRNPLASEARKTENSGHVILTTIIRTKEAGLDGPLLDYQRSKLTFTTQSVHRTCEYSHPTSKWSCRLFWQWQQAAGRMGRGEYMAGQSNRQGMVVLSAKYYIKV